MPLADTQACVGAHDRGDHAPLFRLVVIQPVDESVGVRICSEDLEFADRYFVRWFPRHDSCLAHWGIGTIHAGSTTTSVFTELAMKQA